MNWRFGPRRRLARWLLLLPRPEKSFLLLSVVRERMGRGAMNGMELNGSDPDGDEYLRWQR